MIYPHALIIHFDTGKVRFLSTTGENVHHLVMLQCCAVLVDNRTPNQQHRIDIKHTNLLVASKRHCEWTLSSSLPSPSKWWWCELALNLDDVSDEASERQQVDLLVTDSPPPPIIDIDTLLGLLFCWAGNDAGKAALVTWSKTDCRGIILAYYLAPHPSLTGLLFNIEHILKHLVCSGQCGGVRHSSSTNTHQPMDNTQYRHNELTEKQRQVCHGCVSNPARVSYSPNSLPTHTHTHCLQ